VLRARYKCCVTYLRFSRSVFAHVVNQKWFLEETTRDGCPTTFEGGRKTACEPRLRSQVFVPYPRGCKYLEIGRA
jgi:hypothetical protein